ncbi:hypothetical protein D3C77_678120 [compost metagenome]
MARAFLANVDAYQWHTKAAHATQGIQQLTVGDDAHAAGLQRLVTGEQRFPQLFVIHQQIVRLQYALAFQAAFQISLRAHQLAA